MRWTVWEIRSSPPSGWTTDQSREGAACCRMASVSRFVWRTRNEHKSSTFDGPTYCMLWQAFAVTQRYVCTCMHGRVQSCNKPPLPCEILILVIICRLIEQNPNMFLDAWIKSAQMSYSIRVGCPFLLSKILPHHFHFQWMASEFAAFLTTDSFSN